MKKTFFSIVLLMALFAYSLPASAAKMTLVMDEVVVPTDVDPQVKNSRVMVPIRVISENLGTTVQWDGQYVILQKRGISVKLSANSKVAVVNGESVVLDSAPYIVNSRVLVPTRFLAETFGATVAYKNGIVTVTSPPFSIGDTKIVALNHVYYMTMGGAEEQVVNPSYIARMYDVFTTYKGAEIEEPAAYFTKFMMASDGDYYVAGQYAFFDEADNIVKQFDLYSKVNAQPSHFIVQDVLENKWYAFTEKGLYEVMDTMNIAYQNGFVKEISNTIP